VHEQRIVHSDLKPANFLLVEGQLKLIDFGIAKAISGDTTSIARESQVRGREPAPVYLALQAGMLHIRMPAG
jgi:serine/threonine protein kinase